MSWPVLGQKAPDFWDQQLHDYIDDADAASTADAAAAAAAAETAQTTADGAAAAAVTAQDTADGAAADLATHEANVANPHAVTKAQVGLGSVDNTSDAAKPVSTAQQTALDLKANLASPTFTGDPKAPTPSTADNDTSIATTAFVKAQAYAPLASPTFTGDPKAPTPSTADNDTSVATTAFVKAQAYAPLASPALTGTPTAPTQASTTNDTSLATTAFVKTASSSLTAQGSELRESFTGMSDGSPAAVAATRQAMTNFQFYSDAAPYVRSGFLSTLVVNNAQAGSYRIAQLSGPVVRTGARFAFSPYTVGGGLMALSIQATSISTKTEGQVPISPMHLTISPTGWSIDVNDTDNTGVETVASGNFDVALTADSTTLHTVEVILDRDRQKCYIMFPDGDLVEFSDSRFALAGTFVYVETFKSAGSLSSKTNALIKEWWADSRAIENIAEIRGRARTPWIAPTPPFSNSWVDEGTNQVLQYRRQGDKVKIRGVIKNGVIGATVFTLPAATALDRGFRPKGNRQFPAAANSAYAGVLIQTNGSVTTVNGSNTWFSIEVEFEIT